MRDAKECERDLALVVALIGLAALTALVAWQGAVILNQQEELRELWKVVGQGHW